MRSGTSIRVQWLALSCGCAAMATASSLVLANVPGTSGWAIAALLFVGAVALLVLAGRLVGHVAASLAMLRERVAGVAGGDLCSTAPSPAPARELTELHTSIGHMIEHLRVVRAEHERSQHELAARTQAMNRLLEFSQTIQGAGRVDQIFPTLCHYLESELGLSNVAILAQDADHGSGVQLRACRPDALIAGPTVAEFDGALCPCLRQSQPRLFKPDGSPVRCTIDRLLPAAGPSEAYCVPFNVGPRTRLVVHMVLPPGEPWTDERRQLAQTYANTAQSSLASLHLLNEAEKQSMTDVLTALYNRRSLEELLQREVALAERHAQPLSVVMIDMDYFKQINDAHGHAAGDHLLRAFADCVRITLRKTDLAFRYGGDEFVIALPQTPLAQAQQVVQKLRQAFASVDFSSAVAHLERQPTLSIGLAERSATMNLLTLSALLSAADQALYEAKAASRDCVRTYQPPKAA